MVALLLISLALVLSWMVLGARKATVAHHTTSLCRSYNAAYFQSLAHQIESITDESHLCVTDVVRQCRCHNPFVPHPQDASKTIRVDQWRDIMQMNVALLQNRTLSEPSAPNEGRPTQPDLVLYGDSITERLLGRFFGRYGPKMQDYARTTEAVWTKAGGGSIDGLPLGISSDEVRDPTQVSLLCLNVVESVLTSFLNLRFSFCLALLDCPPPVSVTEWRITRISAPSRLVDPHRDQRPHSGMFGRRYSGGSDSYCSRNSTTSPPSSCPTG